MDFFRSKWVRLLVLKLRLPGDEDNAVHTMENIRSGVSMYGASTWVLIAAIFIASLGLNVNSTAVIIGAMLISPLMGPILGFGLALGINDIILLKRSIRNFVLMVVVSVITSSLFFWISPVKEVGSELLGRTSPTIYDVLIALVGGAAGIIAGASKLRTGNVIPGVAIATALMPPLCTIGFGIANLQWNYAIGAFYLFMINSVFICFATYFVVRLLGYSKFVEVKAGNKKKIAWIISICILLTAAPSIYLTFHLVKKYFFQQRARQFIQKEITDENHIVVSSKLNYSPTDSSSIKLVLLGDVFNPEQKDILQQKLKNYDLLKSRLILFQGTDSRAAAEGMIKELHSDVQVSVNDLYIRLDSLQKELDKLTIDDSLQKNMAVYLKQKDSTLTRFDLLKENPLNMITNKPDTVWIARVSFSKPAYLINTDSVYIWLSRQFKMPGLNINVQ
jgi:uncharacterized hydrophobic protein (TIGR00271 family)